MKTKIERDTDDATNREVWRLAENTNRCLVMLGVSALIVLAIIYVVAVIWG